ncbi:MAG: T9SS type A sorting domain-containing protein [Flavobacteriales bacterium]|nr:T9SS type A sorting domain-containing protein [Flavobacteriales bacterium]
MLRTLIGQRIIDNTGNMTVSPSRIEGNEGFCLPLGTDRFKFSSCDKLDWRFGEVVAAETNPLVSAQYGINNANSGYQIWWYNPNGGYSFKRFQSHNTTNSLPASPSRAAHFVINGWIGNQLQENVLYNMKVRARVNGTYSTWGPACNFTMNELRAQCPLAKLNDVPGSQYLSCDQSRNWGLGNIVSARPVSRVSASGVGTQNANRYQFRFRLPDESLVTVRTSSSYHLPLNWSVNPLVPGTTYLVDVRASFDNGATWCTDFIQPSVDPWGEICTLTINGGGNLVEESGNATGEQEARMQMYPNPNRGDQLFLSLSNVEEGVESINVDIYDSFGKRVAQRTIGVQDGFVNTTLDLNGELSAGVYMVSIAAGERAITERLVIQP